MQRLLPTIVLLFVLLSGCASEKPTPPPAAAKAAFGTFGVDTAQMDSSVKPGDDLFKYVNGKWLSTFKIPADKASYAVFNALEDKSESDVHALLDELAKTQPAPGSVQKKVVDFYNSWMDQSAIEKRGVEPLKADLDAIGKAKTKADIVKLMGNFDYSGPAGLYIFHREQIASRPEPVVVPPA